MKSSTLIFFITIALFQVIQAQNSQEVINFLENNYYPKQVHADYYIEYNEFELPYDIKEDLETGFSYGITNTHYFKDVVNSGKASEYGSSKKGLSGLLRPEAMNLFKCKLINYAVYDESFVFNADLIGIDLMTGENIFYENVSISGSTKDKKMSTSQMIAKTVREKMTSTLKSIYRTSNQIVELVEVDKDKVKKVAVMNLAFQKNSSPKYASAYIVEKELELEGKPYYIFQKIADLKNPGKKRVGEKRIYDVAWGKKELLQHFNDKTPIYVSHFPLGAYK